MKNTILLLFLSVVFISCKNGYKDYLENTPKVASLNNGIITCDIPLAKDTILLPISRLLSEVEIILLEESDDALVKNDGHITVSENYIGIYSVNGGYKLFEKTGKYLRDISEIGDGPNEYSLSIYDSFIDEENNRIYLLPLRGKYILVFDLEGVPLERIPLPYIVHKGSFKIDNDSKEVTVMALPFPDSPSVIWQQDFKGNIIQEVLANHLTIHHVDYSNDLQSGLNTDEIDFSIVHWNAIADTLYHYNEKANKLQPIFTAIYKQETPQHDYIELPNHYIIQANVTETSDPTHLIIDKEMLTGFYAKFKLDMLGGINTPKWMNFHRGYYTANIYPHEFMEQLEMIMPKKKNDTNLEKILNHLNDNSNNIIILGKLEKESTRNILTDSTDIAVNVYIYEKPVGIEQIAKEKKIIEEDEDRIYGWEDMGKYKNIPELKNHKEYYRKNNRFTDWDKNDQRTATVGYIVEKNGKSSDVKILESSGVQELDDEAVRLIQEAEFTIGLNLESKPIRVGDMQVVISFPPVQ